MAIVNRLYTALGTSETILTLSNASGFPAISGVVQIDSEKIAYNVSSPSQLVGLTRGYAGTSAATHLANAIVTFVSSDDPVGVGDLSGTAPVSVANGNNTLAGQSATISMLSATTARDGYLTSTDWTTFNAKQAGGVALTSLTGDVTTSTAGAAAATIGAGKITPAMIAASGIFAFPSDVSVGPQGSGGALNLATYSTIQGNFSPALIAFNIGGPQAFAFGNGVMSVNTRNSKIQFLVGGYATAVDAAICSNAAGVLEINDGNVGTFRDLQVRNLKADTRVHFTPITSTVRDALTPAEGDVVYNVTTHKLNVYTGAAWETVTSI